MPKLVHDLVLDLERHVQFVRPTACVKSVEAINIIIIIIIIIDKVLIKVTLNKVIAGALYIVICG